MKKTLLSILAAAATMSMAAQETVYFQEDFEWLKPWAEAGNNEGKSAGQTIECNNGSNNYAPQVIIPLVDGKSAYDALLEKGYKFEFKYDPMLDPESPDVAIYLQSNYLKFNKTGKQGTSAFQAAMVLPAFDNVPADGKLNVSFDWCPMIQGSGTYDATQMAVLVRNEGEEDVEFKAPEHKWETSSPMAWTTATLSIEGVKAGSTIIIRNTNAGWAKTSAQRWFIDNIKFTGAAPAGIDGIVADNEAPVEYFNLQGIRVAEPSNGLYIRRQGKEVTKVMVK